MKQKMRPFQASDWLGSLIACPHCGKVLEVVKAAGPFVGYDPSENNRLDQWWDLTLADGFHARMWEDRKGVIISGPASAEHRN